MAAQPMQSRLLFLLLLGSSAGTAEAAAAAAITPCDAVAAHVKSAATDPSLVRRPRGQDYDDYDRLLAPIIRFPQPKLADADLWARAKRFLEADFGDQVYEVQQVAGPVWRAVRVAGTAECQTERFFTVRPDGGLRPIDTPAVFGDLCWFSSRRVGEANGRSALIEQEVKVHPQLGVDLEITPWTSGELRTCQVAVRFDDAFRLTERFCADDPSVCVAGEPLALKLAEALARADDSTTMAAVAPPPPQQAQALAARLVKAKEIFEGVDFGYTELPTFGAKPSTKYPIYSGSPQVTLIALAGRTFIARVGIGGIGWRELGDYLIALYSGDGDDLGPIASYVVERKNIGLRSVTTSVPKPLVNNR
jgi:hypothetical protein